MAPIRSIIATTFSRNTPEHLKRVTQQRRCHLLGLILLIEMTRSSGCFKMAETMQKLIKSSPFKLSVAKDILKSASSLLLVSFLYFSTWLGFDCKEASSICTGACQERHGTCKTGLSPGCRCFSCRAYGWYSYIFSRTQCPVFCRPLYFPVLVVCIQLLPVFTNGSMIANPTDVQILGVNKSSLVNMNYCAHTVQKSSILMHTFSCSTERLVFSRH